MEVTQITEIIENVHYKFIIQYKFLLFLGNFFMQKQRQIITYTVKKEKKENEKEKNSHIAE